MKLSTPRVPQPISSFPLNTGRPLTCSSCILVLAESCALSCGRLSFGQSQEVCQRPLLTHFSQANIESFSTSNTGSPTGRGRRGFPLGEPRPRSKYVLDADRALRYSYWLTPSLCSNDSICRVAIVNGHSRNHHWARALLSSVQAVTDLTPMIEMVLSGAEMGSTFRTLEGALKEGCPYMELEDIAILAGFAPI